MLHAGCSKLQELNKPDRGPVNSFQGKQQGKEAAYMEKYQSYCNKKGMRKWQKKIKNRKKITERYKASAYSPIIWIWLLCSTHTNAICSRITFWKPKTSFQNKSGWYSSLFSFLIFSSRHEALLCWAKLFMVGKNLLCLSLCFSSTFHHHRTSFFWLVDMFIYYFYPAFSTYTFSQNGFLLNVWADFHSSHFATILIPDIVWNDGFCSGSSTVNKRKVILVVYSIWTWLWG